jgi:hypothetical protein
MHLTITLRRLAIVGASVGAVLAGAGAASAQTTAQTTANRVTATTPGAVTKTFSYIAAANSKTLTLVNIDSLLINARCGSSGQPIVFAFSSAPRADIFARVFDGFGRLHVSKNTAFTNKTKGIALSPSSGDFDATGTSMFETSTGKVVTVNLAMDNSTTLVGANVCTIFGSLTAS